MRRRLISSETKPGHVDTERPPQHTRPMKRICLILAIGCSFLACTESDSNSHSEGGADGSATDGGGQNESGSGATGSGGSSAGGRAGGGTSSGTAGAGTAGNPSGNTGGTSNNTGSDCERSADCDLISDCCGTCESFPEGEGVAVCMMACDAGSDGCVQQGVVGAVCINGSCDTQVNCDESDVTCDMMISCIAGLVPSVVGNCYGDCVVPDRCAP